MNNKHRPDNPLELWEHPEFIAGHSAGADWWNSIKPGHKNPKPQCPYSTEEQRRLWERGFDWGADDAETAYYS